MNIRILARPEGEVAAYAEAELLRCLTLMDPTVAEGDGGLSLTLTLLDSDPTKDTVKIDVKDGQGVIGGANPCALLIATYRFLYELGCRWTHPGKGGELIPARTLCAGEIAVSVNETPARRHRGVCIEGAVSEENVVEMIEFLPRVGMNSYFIQFFRPTVFFQRWYEHWHNPTLTPETKSPEEIDAITARIGGEIAKRGLHYHAVGHGWTCVPFGIEGEGWHMLDESSLPAEYIDLLAELDGERKTWHGVPLNTNLCYSRPEIRTRMAEAVRDYCRDNPAVDTLHLWLADGTNNNCECPACRDTRPADYYVMLLNEVDELLTEAGLDTKVVFLIYVDLLWAPEREVIKNPDRFIMMFAPITRTYSQTLREGAESAVVDRRPFVRNKLQFPADVATNISYLDDWRKMFSGSSFIFDYHLMWDHACDPGYMQSARTLFEDMKDLDLLGLDGMISCQLSRSALPTALPLYGMARALWDKNADFDAVANEYFTAEYGPLAADVRAFLTALSDTFDPRVLRNETPRVDPEAAARIARIPAIVSDFLVAHPEVTVSSEHEPLRALAYHCDIVTMLSMLLCRRAKNEPLTDLQEAIRAYLARIEPEVQHRLDLWNYSANIIGNRAK